MLMSQTAPDSEVFNPQQAADFRLIDGELHLSDDELALLAHRGFMITERLTFEQFKRAYAWIYWKDLPVLVTTDAILHAIHQTYDEMLKRVEMDLLTQKLIEMLTGVRAYLGEINAPTNARLLPLYTDLDTYLTMPLTLLSRNPARPLGWYDPRKTPTTPMEVWLSQISEANFADTVYLGDNPPPKTVVGVANITLFNLTRPIDFTQFRARGHYDEPGDLVNYFTAIMWLQLMDFRFVEYDPFARPILHREQLAAAALLRDAIDQSQQRANWEAIDRLLAAFIGWSDNITLRGLDRLIADAGIYSPQDFLDTDEDCLLRLLTENDYGQQRIRGQLQARHRDYQGDLPHHISFALMGQRYTLESDILQQVVYDKLIVEGERVERAYPSPLDVLAALGSDRARDHLADELATYGYRPTLDALREWVRSHSSDFWQNTFYNHWLHAITTLNTATTNARYPQAMRSTAWADKTLHTQLGSWAQLRHDNILYAKPPFSPMAVCEYPGGWVEPYPELYAALRDYARFGREVFLNLTLDDPGETLEEARQRLNVTWHNEMQLRPHRAARLHSTLLAYFDDLERVMTRLESLSLKELAGEPFSEEDRLFLRSIVVRKYVGQTGYGGWTEEHWDGWYNDLLPFGDDTACLVTDVHTNYNREIGEVGVLHIGTGDPAVMVLMDDTGGLYVGPAFTYFDHLEVSDPPQRLLDWEWAVALGGRTPRKPHRPDWTSSFRLDSASTTPLRLPKADQISGND
jgi:hypothetical protein